MRRFPLPSLLSLAVLAACQPQLKDKGLQTVNNLATAPVTDQGGTVGITDGSNVSLPPGAVALGTNVTVQKVAQPTEFAAVGAPVAGAPVAVSATGPDGAPLSSATSPMTVSLTVGASSSLLLASASPDNLCVLLKARDSSLYVWRRSAITYDDGKKLAQIQTIEFGTFQLVYCGDEALSGFTDATLSNATGAKQLSVAMTVPSGYDADLAPAKSCLLVLADTQPSSTAAKETVKVLAVKETAYQSGTEQPLALSLPAAALTTGPTFLVGVAFSTGACPFKVGDDVNDGSTRAGLVSIYAFNVTGDALTAGVSGKLGDAPYKTAPVNFALGGPSPVDTYVRPDVPTVCLSADTDFGHVQRLVAFTNGEIAKVAKFPLATPFAQATTGKLEVEVRIGQDCTTFDDAPGDPIQGLPYQLTLGGSNVASGVTYSLTPVSLHVSSSNPATSSLNGCLQVGVPGAFTAGTQPLGHVELALSGGVYPLYLPYETPTSTAAGALPTYDMQVLVLDDGGTCVNKKTSLPPVLLKDKTLSSDIDVAL